VSGQLHAPTAFLQYPLDRLRSRSGRFCEEKIIVVCRPLLGNARRETRLLPRQRISAQTSRNCWKRCFLRRSLPRSYKRGEGLASRRRRGKGNPVLRGIIMPLCSRGIYIRGDLALQVGRVSNLTVKCGHESRWTRTWEWLRWRGLAAIVNDRPILSSERMLHKHYGRSVQLKKNAVHGSQGDLTPRRTDWR
jgi:hypothetical protein